MQKNDGGRPVDTELCQEDLVQKCPNSLVDGTGVDNAVLDEAAINVPANADSRWLLGPIDAGKALFFGNVIGALARGILRVPEGYGAIINICFLIWPVYAVWKKRLSYKDVFHTNFVWNPDFGFLAVLAVGISCAELLIIEGIDLLFKGRLADWAGLFPSAQMPDSLIQTILIVAVAVPIIEELLFRGFLLTAFSQWGHGWAVVFPGLVFALLHHPAGMLGAFAAASVSAISVIHYKSIVPAIVIHASGNLFLDLLEAFHGWVQPPLVELFCIGIRVGFVLAVFLLRHRLAWIWYEFRRYWSEFVKRPQFKYRLKSLMKHWSWILVIILLAVTVVTVVLISIFGELG